MKNLSKKDWEKGNFNKPCVFKFYTEQCINCKIQDKIIEDVEKENKRVTFYSVDAIKEKELALNYGIKTDPTNVFIDCSLNELGIIKTVIPGLLAKPTLNKLISDHLLPF